MYNHLYYPEHDRTSCDDQRPINATAEGSTGCARCTAIKLDQRDQAIAHLHAILNKRRTATSMMEAEDAAREFLRSLGNDCPDN